MTPEALRIAKELRNLLEAYKGDQKSALDGAPSLLRTRRPVGYDRESRPFPPEKYCDSLPDPDDPRNWVNGRMPRLPVLFGADRAKLDRERDTWSPIFRAAMARYAGARALVRRRRLFGPS